MKGILTTLAMCALLLGSATTNAQAQFTWDGTPSDAWTNGKNWGGGAGAPYPGRDQNGDDAVIDDTTDGPAITVDLLTALANTLNNLIIKDGDDPFDASGDDAAVILYVGDSGGGGDENETFATVTGTMTIGHGSAENTESYVEKQGEDLISVTGSIVIQGGSTNQPTTLVVSNGSIVTS